MFGIEFIEVGIGIFFAFFALSTICSTLVEIFVKFTHVRSKHLRTALGDLLGEKNVNGLVDELYDHHLITHPLKQKFGRVSYIAASDFSQAVLDLLGGVADSSLYQAYLNRINRMPDGSAKTELLRLIQANPVQAKAMEADCQQLLADADFKAAALKLLRSFSKGTEGYQALENRINALDKGLPKTELLQIIAATQETWPALGKQAEAWVENPSFAQGLVHLLTFGSKDMRQYVAMESKVKEIENPAIRKGLLSLLEGSATKLGQMRGRLEGWFNGAMDDVSRLYRKRMRFFVGGVAVVVVCLMNADAVRLARTLWNDDELRQATVHTAEQYVSDEKVRMAAQDSTQSFTKLIANVQHQIDESHKLPLGWNSEPLPWQDDFPATQNEVWWWLNKILGLLISIAAISLGSTYWYQQLKSLLQLRFSLSSPKTSPVPSTGDKT